MRLLNRRNCVIKSYNHQFRMRQREEAVFCHDLGTSGRLPPEIGFARNYCLLVSDDISPKASRRDRARWRDYVILAALGSNHRGHHRPLWRNHVCFRQSENEISSEEICWGQLGASRFASNTSCFLPGGSKQLALRAAPALSLAVFFRDKMSNNNPFPDRRKFLAPTKSCFRRDTWAGQPIRAASRYLQSVIRRDIRNYWTR